ncbi:MAG: pentapeptide repeat-containing protein [Candidatus Binatia bacterium]
MANKEQFTLLKQGVDVWNEWRKSNPEIRPDLSGANLFKMDLSEANLTDTNLQKAILRKADLYEATLIGANLQGADLFGADLRRADLYGADLLLANLRGADLYGADLRWADLEGVKSLTQQQLEKAQIDEKTNLPDYVSKPSPLLPEDDDGGIVE